MPASPFQPPKTEVVDARQIVHSRPQTVRLASQLVLAAFAIGLVRLFSDLDILRAEDADLQAVFPFIVVAILVTITLCLIYMTHQGRNWARWALLAYFILGWYPAAEAAMSMSVSERSTLDWSLDLVITSMELIAAWLLFTGSSAKWFVRHRRSHTEA